MLVCLTIKGEDGGGTVKTTFFQACCYIFLSCEVDRYRQPVDLADSSVNIYLSNGSCLTEMGARFYFEDADFAIIFFPQSFLSRETRGYFVVRDKCQ